MFLVFKLVFNGSGLFYFKGMICEFVKWNIYLSRFSKTVRHHEFCLFWLEHFQKFDFEIFGGK